MKRVLAICCVLAGCVQPEPQALGEVTLPLRNPTAQIASQANVTPDRLYGQWVVVQGAGLPPGTQLTISKGEMRIGGVALRMTNKGQGRFVLGDMDIWVHWLDFDNRTAAMGDPQGRRVWIMDRTGNPGERLKAAREILDWYGYDLSRLSGTS